MISNYQIFNFLYKKSIRNVFSALFLWTGLFVNAQVEIVDPSFNVNIRSAELFVDTTAAVTFDQILTDTTLKFEALLPANAAITNFSANYWIRFRLSGESNQTVVMQSGKYDLCYLYYPKDSNRYVIQKSGFNFKLDQRSVYHTENVFTAPVMNGDKDYYYVRIHSGHQSGLVVYPIPVSLSILRAFKSSLYFGFFFGIIFLAMLYSLILYIRIRESAYLYYALYVISFGLFAMMDWGFIVEIPGISGMGYNKNFYTIPFMAMTCFLLLYARSFLDTKDNLPFYHQLLTILVVGRIIVYLVGFITDLDLLYNPINDDIFLLGAFVAGFVRLRQGYAPARYFLVAFFVAYLGFFFHAFNYYLNIAPDWLVKGSGLYNTGTVEMILFSFGLAERFRFLKKEKDKSSLETIRYLEENNKLKDDAINQLQENLLLKENVQKSAKDRVMQKRVTFEEFKQIYPDDEACFKFLEELKWRKGFVCSKCGNTKYSKGNAEHSRRCSKCNHIERLFTGTVFSGIKFPITKAFYMLFLVNSGKNTTVDELSQSLNLRKQTCWVFRKKLQDVIASKGTRQKNKDGWSHLIMADE